MRSRISGQRWKRWKNVSKKPHLLFSSAKEQTSLFSLSSWFTYCSAERAMETSAGELANICEFFSTFCLSFVISCVFKNSHVKSTSIRIFVIKFDGTHSRRLKKKFLWFVVTLPLLLSLQSSLKIFSSILICNITWSSLTWLWGVIGLPLDGTFCSLYIAGIGKLCGPNLTDPPIYFLF